MSQPPFGSLLPTQPFFLPTSSTCFTIFHEHEVFLVGLLCCLFFFVTLFVYFFYFCAGCCSCCCSGLPKNVGRYCVDVNIVGCCPILHGSVHPFCQLGHLPRFYDFDDKYKNMHIHKSKRGRRIKVLLLVICAAEITSIYSIHSNIRVTDVTKSNN